MAYAGKILKDSISPAQCRITTFEITYPRFVHSELMTHRVFSRNSASSRAIPFAKMVEQVQTDPVMPVWWGKNQSGMQSKEELVEPELSFAKIAWLNARDSAVSNAMSAAESGMHKQLVNRLLEPWMWITVLVTATEFENFFGLRCHPDAQPEIRYIAEMMKDSYYASTPAKKLAGEWHIPMIGDGTCGTEVEEDVWRHSSSTVLAVATGRLARVSYLTHDGKRDLQADVDLHDRLAKAGHMSPFEHCAMAQSGTEKNRRSQQESPHQSGNFFGWTQYRKMIPGEAIFKGSR